MTVLDAPKNILSFYASHDSSATFIDKNGDLRVLELERFANIRYAMFSSEHEHWSIGVNNSIRKDFVSHIKSLINNDFDLVVYSGCNDNDLNILKEYFPKANYEKFNAHHISHAYSAYFLSPFKDAWIFSIDGGGADYGEFTTTKIFTAKDSNIETFFNHNTDYGSPYVQIGAPMSEISFGKDPSDIGVTLAYAGKIMGLCAYGKIIPEWIRPIEQYYKHIKGGTHACNQKCYNILGKAIGLNLNNYRDCLSGKDSYNLAATSQFVFEKFLSKLIVDIFECDNKNIVLTGGCALNVLFNQKLKKFLVSRGYDLYVPPSPNDCGQSLGMYLSKTKKHIDCPVYSGFDILDRKNFANLLRKGDYKIETATPKKIVDLIVDGKIGGIIRGYSEIGPRALGNRSIICDPSFKDMKDILNAKVKFREWFRPFAPVCREEDMHNYFDDAYASQYMSYAPAVKSEYKEKLPAITHADGTARLQTVTRQQHTLFYDILTNMKEREKIPIILNTSFNIRGKPILTRLSDAFYVLDNTELDFLIFETILIFKQN